jgi:pilus assembly protein Flp/PilA
MRTIISLVTASRLLQDRRGATAIEYGLIVAGISVVIAATVATIGTDVAAMFTDISTKLGGGAS